MKFLKIQQFWQEILQQVLVKNNQLVNINLNYFIMEFVKKFMTEKAEKFNGKAAMIGMFALVGAYYFTGQIVPGIF